MTPEQVPEPEPEGHRQQLLTPSPDNIKEENKEHENEEMDIMSQLTDTLRNFVETKQYGDSRLKCECC